MIDRQPTMPLSVGSELLARQQVSWLTTNLLADLLKIAVYGGMSKY